MARTGHGGGGPWGVTEEVARTGHGGGGPWGVTEEVARTGGPWGVTEEVARKCSVFEKLHGTRVVFFEEKIESHESWLCIRAYAWHLII